MRVVLPVPFFPSRPTTEPVGIASDTWSRTRLESKDLLTLLRVRTNSLTLTLLESGLNQRQNLFGRQAGISALFDEAADETDHFVAIDGLPLTQGPPDDAHPLPADQFDDAVPLQKRIGLGNGHRVDGQLARHLADRREKLAGSQPPGRDLRPDLVQELPINRHSGTRGHVKAKPAVDWHSVL